MKLGLLGKPPTPLKGSPPKTVPPPVLARYAPTSLIDPRLPVASIVVPLEVKPHI